jgi:nitric oxide reductase large subunit
MFKVNDKVIGTIHGKGTITDIDVSNYPIKVLFESTQTRSFLINGDEYNYCEGETIILDKSVDEPTSKTYTEEEVIQLLIKERTRAKDIAYEYYKANEDAYAIRQSNSSVVAFVKREIANECRLIGNTISGINALGATLGETIESKIREQFKS